MGHRQVAPIPSPPPSTNDDAREPVMGNVDKNLGTDGTYPKFQFAKARERPVCPALSRGSADKKPRVGHPAIAATQFIPASQALR